MVMVTVSFNIKTMKKICGRIQGQENVETDNTFFLVLVIVILTLTH